MENGSSQDLAFDVASFFARVRKRWLFVTTLMVLGMVGGLAAKWLTRPPPSAVVHISIGPAGGLAPDISSYRVLFEQPTVTRLADGAVVSIGIQTADGFDVSVTAPDPNESKSIAEKLARQVAVLATNRLQLQRCREALDLMIAQENSLHSLAGQIEQQHAGITVLNANRAPGLRPLVDREVLLAQVRLRQAEVLAARIKKETVQARQARLLIDQSSIEAPAPDAVLRTLHDFVETGGLLLLPGIDPPAVNLVVATPVELRVASTKRSLLDGMVVGLATGVTIAIGLLLLAQAQERLSAPSQ